MNVCEYVVWMLHLCITWGGDMESCSVIALPLPRFSWKKQPSKAFLPATNAGVEGALPRGEPKMWSTLTCFHTQSYIVRYLFISSSSYFHVIHVIVTFHIRKKLCRSWLRCSYFDLIFAFESMRQNFKTAQAQHNSTEEAPPKGAALNHCGEPRSDHQHHLIQNAKVCLEVKWLFSDSIQVIFFFRVVLYASWTRFVSISFWWFASEV